MKLPRHAFFAALALLALTSLPSCKPSTEESAPAGNSAVAPPILVETSRAEWTDMALPIAAPGIVSRKTEADLAFTLDGIIATVNVRAGDTVTAGQELAALRLDGVEAQVTQAQAALEKARRDLERAEGLYQTRAVSLGELQNTRTATAQAAAALRSAEFLRRYSVITAPGDGRILARNAEPEEVIPAGRPVLRFASETEGWLVRAGLPETDVVRTRVGDRAEVALSAWPGQTFPAVVAHIAEEADAQTRTTAVELSLKDIPDNLRSGLVARCVLFPQPLPGARPAVPISALVEGDGRTAHLFLVNPTDPDAVRRMAVEVEVVSGPIAYLLAPGVPDGSEIVSTGAEYLRDGSRIARAPSASVATSRP